MILKRAVAVSTPTASRVRFDLNSKEEKRIVTSAKYKAEVMTSDAVRMTVGSVSPLTFKLRDYVEYDGQYYFLNLLPTAKKEGSWKYTYDMDLEGAMYELGRVVFKIDPAYGFDYMGTMYEICNFITRSLEQANLWIKVCGYPTTTNGVTTYAWTNYFVFDTMTENGPRWRSIEGGYYMDTSLHTISTSQWGSKKSNYKGQVTLCPETSSSTEVSIYKYIDGSLHVYGQQYILEVGGTWSLNFERDALTANSNIVATKEELCSFDQHTCLAVLQELMNTYEGWQWEVRYNGDTVDNNKPMLVGGRTCVGGVLYLRKSETGFHKYVANSGIYPVDNDFAITEDWELSYGKGNGLKNIKRSYVNDGYLPTKIYCYGSNQNVPSTYRSTRICLPNKEQNESYVRVDDSITPDWIDVNAENEETEVVKVFDEAMPANKPFEVAAYSGKTISVLQQEVVIDMVPNGVPYQQTDSVSTAASDETIEDAVAFSYDHYYSCHLLIYPQTSGLEHGRIKSIGFRLFRKNTLNLTSDSGVHTGKEYRLLRVYLCCDGTDNKFKYLGVKSIPIAGKEKGQFYEYYLELEDEIDWYDGSLSLLIVDYTGGTSKCHYSNVDSIYGTRPPYETLGYSDPSMVQEITTNHFVYESDANSNPFPFAASDIDAGIAGVLQQLTATGITQQKSYYLPQVIIKYGVVDVGESIPTERVEYSYTNETLSNDIFVYKNRGNKLCFDFWVWDRDYDEGERHPIGVHNFYDVFAKWKEELLDPAEAGDMYLDWEFGNYNEWRSLHFDDGLTELQNRQRYHDYWVNRYAYRQSDGSFPVVTFLTGECAGMSFTITDCTWELWKPDGTSGGGYEQDDEGQYYHWLGKKYFRVTCLCNTFQDEYGENVGYNPDIATGIIPAAGDEFVIENISMPAMYTVYQGQGDEFSAEAQLQAAAEKYVRDLTDKYKYDVEIATDYLVTNSPVFRKFDKIRLTDNAIVESKEISGGSVVTNHYKDVTVTSVENDLIKPDCKIEVSNYRGKKNITIAVANAMVNNVTNR